MERTEFERTTPEAVGIASASVERLLDRLESGFTEMHSIQIMRHGMICAEGWWSPYAPGIRHSLMSVTKTYAATAIGIACTEGLISLSDRIIDIFPDKCPAYPDELLKKMTIRDILCMGGGMITEPLPTGNWIKDFIATPVIHPPGTRFMYNSVGSSLLGAIIQKVSGQGLHAYLKPRLFDKIGICSDNLRWAHMADGIDAGGAGLFATTEDNLRLMKLYADGGVWNGERILPKEYVEQAISKQIDTALQALNYPFANDSFCGYGYQIWMCRPEGVYRADGAMGQFAVVFPQQDMIISITETGNGIDGPQKTLDALWLFLDELTDAKTLSEDPARSSQLKKRLATLSLPHPPYRPFSPKVRAIDRKRFSLTSGTLQFENQTLSVFCGSRLSRGISQFAFRFGPDACTMEFTQDGMPYMVHIALNGARTMNELRITGEVATRVYLSGFWTTDDTFAVKARWIETSFEKDIQFHFIEADSCTIITSDPLNSFGPLGALDDAPATAVRQK